MVELQRITVNSLIILILFCIGSTKSLAENKDQFLRIEIKKGDKAPFKGILITNALLARLITNLEKRIETLQIKLSSKDKISENQIISSNKITEALVAAQQAKTEALNRDLIRQKEIYERALNKASATPPWYKSRYLSFITGALISGGVCIGTSIANKGI